MEQAGKEDIGHTDETVVLLLVEEGVGPLEVATHHLRRRSEMQEAKLGKETTGERGGFGPVTYLPSYF